MIPLFLSVIFVSLQVLYSIAASNSRDGVPESFHFHKHNDHDLDVVQCNHTFYRINQINGKPELVSGQESRVDPSRQYLPLPAPINPSNPPIGEDIPAATYDQPNYLKVENTFVSPTLQKNYKSLFGDPKKPDLLSPSAAQNIPSKSVGPSEPRKISNIKHSDENDENNLERLCNDAFHSFLCKPIKGPRKTPTGRIRENAVLPPEVLAGFSSSQNNARSKPDTTVSQSVTEKVQNPSLKQFKKHSQLNPSNSYSQNIPYPTPFSSSFDVPKNPTPSVPFINILNNDRPQNPIIPDPSNTNSRFLKPQPVNAVPAKVGLQTSGYSYNKPNFPFQQNNPSNQNLRTITISPTYNTSPATYTTPGYSYEKPNIAFPSNNVPLIAKPPQRSQLSSHDCDKNKPSGSTVIGNPSNDNLQFIRPSLKTSDSRRNPTFPLPSNNIPQLIHHQQANPLKQSVSQANTFTITSSPSHANPSYVNSAFVRPSSESLSNPFTYTSKPQSIMPLGSTIRSPSSQLYSNKKFTSQECDKNKKVVTLPVGNPSNESPSFIKPVIQTTSKPFTRTFSFQPYSPLPSNNLPAIASSPAVKFAGPAYECDKGLKSMPSLLENPTNQNPVFFKPGNQLPTKPFVHMLSNQVKLPSSSGNNIAQIIGQPQQINIVTISPKASQGYFYEKPSIPFPSPGGYPSNQNSNFLLKPSQRPVTFETTTINDGMGYVYNQPRVPFPSNNIPQIISRPKENKVESHTSRYSLTTIKPHVPCDHEHSMVSPSSIITNPTNQNVVILKPTTNTDGTSKPSNPTNNIANIVGSPANNGYTYQKPANTNNHFNFNPSLNRPQTTTTIPALGYSYNQPKIPFISNTIQKAALQDSKPNFEANAGTQVEINVRPEYSYNQPSNSFASPQQTKKNLDFDGYSYPKPAIPFAR